MTEGIRIGLSGGAFLHVGEVVESQGELMTVKATRGAWPCEMFHLEKSDGTKVHTSRYNAAITRIDNRYQTADVVAKRNGPPWTPGLSA
jgi:hypothetical protein